MTPAIRRRRLAAVALAAILMADTVWGGARACDARPVTR